MLTKRQLTKVVGYRYAPEKSLEYCVGDAEPTAEDVMGKVEEDIFEDQIKRKYCGTKRAILELLIEGYSFKDAAFILSIRLSDIYEIKKEFMKDFAYLRISGKPLVTRKAMKATLLKNLIYLYFLIHPQVTAKEMDENWCRDKVLNEYRKPPYNIISGLLRMYRQEFRISI